MSLQLLGCTTARGKPRTTGKAAVQRLKSGTQTSAGLLGARGEVWGAGATRKGTDMSPPVGRDSIHSLFHV